MHSVSRQTTNAKSSPLKSALADNRDSLKYSGAICEIRENKVKFQLEKVGIIVADDHEVCRNGTRQILEGEADFEVLGEAANGQEAVQLCQQLRPKVVVMDVSMPIMDGIEATRQIKASNPEVVVLILSAYDNDEFVFSLLEAGAAGYILKDARGIEIVQSIRAILRGESVLHPVIARKVINRFFSSMGGEKEENKTLGVRELEVLSLARNGLSNQEIANELKIVLSTVESHMRHIFAKLKVGSRTEAILYAIKQGWITLAE
jgi:DNA-binding NarL/FixJ family response regulator